MLKLHSTACGEQADHELAGEEAFLVLTSLRKSWSCYVACEQAGQVLTSLRAKSWSSSYKREVKLVQFLLACEQVGLVLTNLRSSWSSSY